MGGEIVYKGPLAGVQFVTGSPRNSFWTRGDPVKGRIFVFWGPSPKKGLDPCICKEVSPLLVARIHKPRKDNNSLIRITPLKDPTRRVVDIWPPAEWGDDKILYIITYEQRIRTIHYRPVSSKCPENYYRFNIFPLEGWDYGTQPIYQGRKLAEFEHKKNCYNCNYIAIVLGDHNNLIMFKEYIYKISKRGFSLPKWSEPYPPTSTLTFP